MNKFNFNEIARSIKKLGYEVAINKCESVIFFGNGKAIVELSKPYTNDSDYIIPNFVCKNTNISYNGIGPKDENHPYIKCASDITKELLDKALCGPKWAQRKDFFEPCTSIKNIILYRNKELELCRFKIIDNEIIK